MLKSDSQSFRLVDANRHCATNEDASAKVLRPRRQLESCGGNRFVWKYFDENLYSTVLYTEHAGNRATSNEPTIAKGAVPSPPRPHRAAPT